MKSQREIIELLQVLVESAKTFFNVLILSLLALFIYSLMGLRFFYDIKEGTVDGGIDKDANFRNMWITMMTLTRVETLDGWNSLMHETLLRNSWPVTIYWISFILIKVYILLNVVIAVIFEKL